MCYVGTVVCLSSGAINPPMRRKNRAVFKASGAIVTPAGFLLSPFFQFFPSREMVYGSTGGEEGSVVRVWEEGGQDYSHGEGEWR